VAHSSLIRNNSRIIFFILPFFPLFFFSVLSSCHAPTPLVPRPFIDSLISHYSLPALATQNKAELNFWRSRIDPARPGYLNESRYAAALALDFHFFGEIDSLKKADSMLSQVNRVFNFHEAAPNLALASHSITEHHFSRADTFLQTAKQIGLKPYESLTTSFDVDFELGRYAAAKAEINSLNTPSDYGYLFRKSKLDHLHGNLDSSIRDMLNAADLVPNNPYLQSIALATAADLYIHAGNLKKAAELYTRCILLNSADFHSLLGLGFIAYTQDHDGALAARIYHFVAAHNKLPDALFKLAQLAETGNGPNSSTRQTTAQTFIQKATDPRYGRMYNKYLLQLYTGILHKPGLAEELTRDELHNRATPQTYAWYAWALFSNGKSEEAYIIFTKYVSGKPLEALELYWMGKLMKGLDKGFDAQQFFKAAAESRYDLGPAQLDDLRMQLKD
jgi:hypothetical protein